ncbi:MAG: M3 family oligoendopeptidase [Ruminococcaceae bacterium]|nr:M3 family oligoendopeptidase [Oscillospiraceae bacterium]
MKVYDIPYTRYTIEEGKAAYEAFVAAFKGAKTVEEALDAREALLDAFTEYETAASLANCRFTLNTADPFYCAEVEYYDEVSPLFEELSVGYADLLLTSPLRSELEKHINPRIFRHAEIAKKTFSSEVIAECQQENAIVTEYSRFMSSLLFDYDGQQLPLSAIRGNLENKDREVRRKTAFAIGEGLQKHSEELDSFYDRLVKIRTEIAKKLGFSSFTELGYCRMGRLDYNAKDVATFRLSVENDLVPVVSEIKKQIAADLGIDAVTFYDNSVYTLGRVPKPKLNTEEIFAAAKKMYREMSKETGDFMDAMLEAEAFDVESRPNKWGGGYCTGFAKYKQPFILANFNGSCGDVDVITHEFGHALAQQFMYDSGERELGVGMETAECHSMSMEFFCWKYTELFFKEDADLYRRKHLLDALSFIPYGVIVDEFQHIVYDNPDLTPKERNEVYLSLEKKYRPYLDYADIPYLKEGTRWQYQMHIFESPFYYIDYCLAQTVSLFFLLASQDNFDEAFANYLAFSKKGGTRAFGTLVEEANLCSPFKEGALKDVALKASTLAQKLYQKTAGDNK